MANKVEVTTISEAFERLAQKTAHVQEQKAAGTWRRAKMGISILDDALGGLLPGVNLLIGETKIGKTTIGMNVAYTNAKAGVNTIIWSSEMTDLQLASLAASIDSGIPRRKWRDYEVTQKDIEFARAQLEESGFANVGILRGNVPRQVLAFLREAKPQLLVVDYLQYLAMSIPGDMRKSIEDITKVFHELAQDLELPILLLSAENSEGKTFFSTLAPFNAVANIRVSKLDEKDLALYSGYKGDPVSVGITNAREGVPAEAIVFIDRTIGKVIGETHLVQVSTDELMRSAGDDEEMPF